MNRYYLTAFFVLAAVLTIEECIPIGVAFVVAAIISSYEASNTR